jgi:protein ImuA
MSPRPVPLSSPASGGGADPGGKPGEAEGRVDSLLSLAPLDSSPAGWGARDFTHFLNQMATQPLHEIGPAATGYEASALGFSLALTASWAGPVCIFWAGEEAAFSEEGAPYPAGLAQYGVALDKLIVVRAKKREEALWAAEQALAAPRAVVICALGAHGKPLDLKASRRLLLFAERSQSRCLLLQPPHGPSAAWTRWSISPAQSDAPDDELGPPSFIVELTRNRAGPSGARFTLDWNAHDRRFAQRAMVGDLSAALVDGSVDPIRARAG